MLLIISTRIVTIRHKNSVLRKKCVKLFKQLSEDPLNHIQMQTEIYNEMHDFHLHKVNYWETRSNYSLSSK